MNVDGCILSVWMLLFYTTFEFDLESFSVCKRKSMQCLDPGICSHSNQTQDFRPTTYLHFTDEDTTLEREIKIFTLLDHG